MSAVQQFVAIPKSPSTRGATANANRDGTGTIVDLYVAGASGGRLDDLTIKGSGASTTLGMIRFYQWDGAAYKLKWEVPVTAATPSGTVPSFATVLVDLGWILQAAYKIGWSTVNAEQFDICMSRGGDF